MKTRIKNFYKTSGLSDQYYLFRLCMESAKGYFLFHIGMCIVLELVVFLEHTVWIGYNLRVVEEKGDFHQLLILTAGMILFLLVHQLISGAYFFWSSVKIKPLLYQKLQERIYDKAQQVDLACYDNPEYYNDFILSTTQAKECVDRFYTDSQEFLRCVTCLLIDLLYLSINSGFALLVVAASFLIKLLTSRSYYRLTEKKKVDSNVSERKRAYQHRVFYLQDYAKELRLHKEMKDMLLEDFEDCNEELNRLNRSYGRKLMVYGFLKEYVSGYMIIYLSYLPYAVWRILVLHNLRVSDMVILMNMVRMMSKKGNKLAQLFPQMKMNSDFIGRIRTFLKYEEKVRPGKEPVRGSQETLALRHVSFSYTPEGKEVLHDINMEFKKGQKVAIVGYNGAGKSTLIKLLMRFYDPDQGVIQRNGQDIRELDTAKYRSGIGSVFQDYKMYAASLRENVVMDSCVKDKKETYEVEKALFDARFTLTDKRLRYQIETPLTTEFEKDGVNLSGGESQKVAIARCLYRNQELIILDEPSSALDPMAEYQLNNTLREIAGDRTVVFISHRLSTTRDADCIYMMEEGRIIEQGTHQELLALQGEYSRMWYAQAGQYVKKMSN